MKIETGLIYAAALSLALNAIAAPAQNAGFRTGIAAPAAGFPPTQAPAVVTRGTFAAPLPPRVHSGQIFIQGQTVFPNQVQFPTLALVPFQQVIIPQQILVPGQTVLPPAVIFPGPAGVSGPGGFPGHPGRNGGGVFTQTSPAFAPPGPPPGPPAGPPAGMPRTEVLRQFGQPTVAVITSSGETLYFNGGITVILQNGQVTRPR